MRLWTLPASDVPPRAVRAKALVFEDAGSLDLLARIEQVGPSDATVLISGETGTGKEIVARHMHELSRRRQHAFVAVNCGAFAESLVESDLFGHERGAFTGATATKAGWFEAAREGTLFLDEVGELPLGLQVKLLRVLQEREVVRLGSRQAIPVDVRVIAATNANLVEEVAGGRFRSDLFYRLNVAGLEIPPLRERPGDILPLADYFVDLYCHRLARGRTVLSDEARAELVAHRWPGNIRELENVVHHALVMCRGDCIGPRDLRLGPLLAVPVQVAPAQAAGPGPDADDQLEAALLQLFEEERPDLWQRIERVVLRTAYQHAGRNQLQTARLLGLSRNVVRARLIQHGELAGPLRGGRASSELRAEPAPEGTVRIGYQKFGLLVLVKARGGLAAGLAGAGYRVEWLEFPGGSQLVDALHDGRIDLGLVGEVAPIVAQAAHAPIVYLAAEPPAPQAEAIVVHADSPIRTVADLKGKTIALNPGANVDYLLVRALEEAQLHWRDVKIAAVPPTGARAAFESREVDAWAIWDPLLASVAHSAGARVLRDGTGLATNTAFYVGRRDFVDTRPALVEAFLAEVSAAGAWANQNPADAAGLLAPELGLPVEAVVRALEATRFGARLLDDAAIAAQQIVADKLYRTQLIARPIRVAEVCWPGPRRRAAM
jgi:aliphatic sulfonates family ABC transporter substrate-binding protein